MKKYLHETIFRFLFFFSFPKENRFIVLPLQCGRRGHALCNVTFGPDYLQLFSKISPDSNTRPVRWDEIDPTIV